MVERNAGGGGGGGGGGNGGGSGGGSGGVDSHASYDAKTQFFRCANPLHAVRARSHVMNRSLFTSKVSS